MMKPRRSSSLSLSADSSAGLSPFQNLNIASRDSDSGDNESSRSFRIYKNTRKFLQKYPASNRLSRAKSLSSNYSRKRNNRESLFKYASASSRLQPNWDLFIQTLSLPKPQHESMMAQFYKDVYGSTDDSVKPVDDGSTLDLGKVHVIDFKNIPKENNAFGNPYGIPEENPFTRDDLKFYNCLMKRYGNFSNFPENIANEDVLKSEYENCLVDWKKEEDGYKGEPAKIVVAKTLKKKPSKSRRIESKKRLSKRILTNGRVSRTRQSNGRVSRTRQRRRTESNGTRSKGRESKGQILI